MFSDGRLLSQSVTDFWMEDSSDSNFFESETSITSRSSSSSINDDESEFIVISRLSVLQRPVLLVSLRNGEDAIWSSLSSSDDSNLNLFEVWEEVVYH